GLADAQPDRLRRRKIEWRAGDGAALAGGDLPPVRRQKHRRDDLHAVIEAISCSGSVEVEIRMRAQRQRRRFRCPRLEMKLERCTGKAVARARLDLAGKALIAIGACQRQDQLLRCRRGDAPEALAEAHRAAMERCAVLIVGQPVGLAIDRDLGSGDAIGVAAKDRAERAARRGIIRNARKAKDNIAAPAFAVGCFERNEDAAVIRDPRPDRLVLQREEACNLAGVLAKGSWSLSRCHWCIVVWNDGKSWPSRRQFCAMPLPAAIPVLSSNACCRSL